MRIRAQATPPCCPHCGRKINWQHVAFANHFRCRSCDTRLDVRGFRGHNLGAASIAWLLAFAAGVRQPWLLVATALGAVPIGILFVLLSLRLFPIVELEPTGDFRGILYPDAGHASVAPAVETQPRRWIGERVWEFFVGINQPPSVEGFALQAGFLALALWMVWASIAPVLRIVVPEFDANRSGPRGFPVKVHIGSWTIAFTNGSDVAWTCRAELGKTPPLGKIHLADTFDLPAGGTVPVEFTRFMPSEVFDQSQLRSAAQDRISLECREPSGRRHFATLQ